MDFSNLNDKEMIGWLEDQGAVIWVGLDPNGEPLFQFNLDKLKEVMPDLHAHVTQEMDEELMKLYQEGLVEMEYNENLEAGFRLSEKGLEIMKEINPDFPFPNM